MTIKEALKKMKKGQTISSRMAKMREQNTESLVHWTMSDMDSDNYWKVQQLMTILNANDWEIDKKTKLGQGLLKGLKEAVKFENKKKRNK